MKIDVMIEMPRWTTVKYELKYGCLRVDRLLDQSVPHNYGFALGTKADDGDPLDVFVLDSPQLQSCSTCSVRIIGALKCLDNGVVDDKLFGLIAERNYIEEAILEVTEYLKTYKKGFKVIRYVGRAEAERIYKESKNT